MTLHVFMSYCRRDAEFGRILGEALRRADHAVLEPEDRERDLSWYAETRRQALDQADVMVCILSHHLLMTEYEWVRLEMQYAQAQRKAVVPILLEPIDFPDDLLACYRVIDFTSDDFMHAFQELLEQIHAVGSPRTQMLRRAIRERLRFFPPPVQPDERAGAFAALVRQALGHQQISPDQYDEYLADHLDISPRFAQSLIKGTFPLDELEDSFLVALAEVLEIDPQQFESIIRSSPPSAHDDRIHSQHANRPGIPTSRD
ncbi:MAG: toll/interleukin-1 receptor domain-containing protein [bacterium]|nr:toll/interleukin-1 receptor domain-containing protein [bacterium]